MTVDSQKDYFWFLIRAWGFGLRSQRVHHGRARSFEELEDLYYRTYFPYAGDCYPPLRCYGGGPVGIDSGGGMDRGHADSSITDRVYRWCLKDPTWRIPLKGASKPFEEHLRWRDVTYTPPGGKQSPYVVRLHLVDPIYWRDLLASDVTARCRVVNKDSGEETEADLWALNDACDEEYNRHLAAVQKVRQKRGRGYVELYVPKSAGARHDYHDLEAYQQAMAHGPGRCFALPSPEQLAAQHAAASRAATAAPSGPRGVTTPDGRPFFATRR